MRLVNGDVNVYFMHDTLTPGNVRAASYGSSDDSGALVPEVGDILRNFPGWTGTEYEAITVLVTDVKQIGDGVVAYEVRTTTVPDWEVPGHLVEDLRKAGAAVEAGRNWYRALGPDGSLWCETSDPVEAAESVIGREGYTLERLPVHIVRTPWEPWTPPADVTEKAAEFHADRLADEAAEAEEARHGK